MLFHAQIGVYAHPQDNKPSRRPFFIPGVRDVEIVDDPDEIDEPSLDPPVADEPGFDWSTIEPSSELVYHDCYTNSSEVAADIQGRLQCARLSLPLDWGNLSNPETADIAIVKLLATVRCLGHCGVYFRDAHVC